MLQATVNDIMVFTGNRIMLKASARSITACMTAWRWQLAKPSPWVKSQSQFNSYSSIRLAPDRLLQYEHSSILSIGWAKLDLFAVDKVWARQPSLLRRTNDYPREGAEDLFRRDVHKVVELLYHWVSAFAPEEILLTLVSYLIAGCERRFF